MLRSVAADEAFRSPAENHPVRKEKRIFMSILKKILDAKRQEIELKNVPGPEQA